MDNGNNHKSVEDMAEENAFKGATIPLSEFQRRDGQFAEAMDQAMQHKLGVIQRLITSVNSDDDYRQILKLVPWRSTEEQDKFTAALDICARTGAKKTFKAICDRLTARTGGLNGWLIQQALEGLTHTTFTSQKYENNKRQYDRSGKNPIGK